MLKRYLKKKYILKLAILLIIGIVLYFFSPFLMGFYAMGCILAAVSSGFSTAFDKNEDFADRNQGGSLKMGEMDGKTDVYLNNDYK